MVDVVESAGAGTDTPDDAKLRRAVPSWVITVGSLVVLLGAWEIFGRDVNPVFGSYPSAIAEAAWQLARTGKLWTALLDSLRPFFLGYGLGVVICVPGGLITGRFCTVEAAIGIYITAGYAMPLVALVPLLVLWLALGFAVKVAVVFLMSVFPICINTWLGVTAVPKTLIEVGKSFVAPNAVILRRIILPATLPYIMAGMRLAVGRAVGAMVIAELFPSLSALGAIIITSANNFDTATMFVPILVLMIMAIGLNYLIGAVERRVAPWQAEIAGRGEESTASLLPGEEIGELDEILVLEVVHHFRHLGVVAPARIVLVAAQGLEQIVLALAGQPGDVFLPGIIGLVTEIAAMLLAQRARLVHARGVGIVGDRLRRRQLRDDVGRLLQLGVGEPLRHLVHGLGDAQPVAEHEQLHRDIEGRLRAERRRLGQLRGASLAVAGKTRRQPCVERLSADRVRSQTGQDR